MERMIKDGSVILKNIIEIYSEFASISRPLWARIITDAKYSLTVESKWSFRDLQRRKKISLARTYILKDVNGKSEISRVTHQMPLSFTAFHPDAKFHAVLKVEDENNEEKQYLQIWNDESLLYTMDVSKSKDHGVIHMNDISPTFHWNGRYLLYLAEAKYDADSFFKEPVKSSSFELTEKMGNEFEWRESWGDVMTKYHHPHLCYLDVGGFKVTVKNSPDNVSPLQAIWGPQQSVVYVGFDEEPYRLGFHGCYNRKSTIYSTDIIKDSSGSYAAITSQELHVRSPRFDPSWKYLVYFQNEYNKTHWQCSQLVLYDWESKQGKILVDIVYDAKDDEFPGIFKNQLPERCFTSDSSHIIFTTLWRERDKVIAVNLKTGAVIDLCKGDLPSSMNVLDVYMDKIIVAAESLNIEPCLMIGHLKISEVQLTVQWEYLDSNAPNKLPDIDFAVQYYEPDLKNSSYPDLKNQFILVYSKTMTSMEQGCPLIIYPHGGPHDCFAARFNPRIVSFAKLGFVVCLVNYRGSAGFGENTIKSLPDNVGVQDVSDVYLAITHAEQLMNKLGILYSGDAFFFGGSHGGLLGASLCGHYSGKFSACALVNPVVDLSSKASETDIPDWDFVESGLTFSYHYPTAEEKALMFSKSPLRYIKNVITPTLLILGAKDLRVPFYQGLSYYKALKSQKVETKLCVYPDDSHGMDSVAGDSDLFVQVAVWFFSHMAKGSKESVTP